MNDTTKIFRHAHLACGIGAGARGFNMKEIWVKPLALALAVDTNQVAFEIDAGRA